MSGTTSSTLSYDANAHLTYASTTGQAAKTISYTTDAAGQVMVRTQTTSGSTTSPRQFSFYFNGLRIGEIGNNGTDNVDYATAIAANGTAARSGPFRGGATTGTSFAKSDKTNLSAAELKVYRKAAGIMLELGDDQIGTEVEAGRLVEVKDDEQG